MGNGDATLGRRRHDSDKIKARHQRTERLVGVQGEDAAVADFQETRHLGFRESLGHECHIDAIARVATLAQVAPRSLCLVAAVANQDIARVYAMAQAGEHTPMGVHQLTNDIDGVARQGNEEIVLEAPLHLPGFLGLLPFLEQGGEAVAIECVAGCSVGHGQLSIAQKGQTLEVVAAAVPTCRLRQLS